MKPEFTTLKKFKEVLSFMNLPVFTYNDSDDFAIIKVHEMGLKMPYLTPAYRPDYYTLTVIKEGKGTFVVGDHVFELGPQHVFIKQPDVYFSSGWTESPVGYSISFTRNFFEKNFSETLDDILKNNISAINYRFNLDDFIQIEQILEDIYNEAVTDSEYKYEMMANLVVNILLLIQHHKSEMRLEIQNEKNNAVVMSFFKNIDNNFNKLILGEDLTVFRTKEHAALLNLTETYLSKTVSKSSGKTINQWVNLRLIEEITFLLKNTDKPIPEIAAIFAFNDLQYFYTFFKKNAKCSASSVRNAFKASVSNQDHVYRGDLVSISPSWLTVKNNNLP